MGENTLEELANYFKRHTDPSIFPSISSEEVDNKNIVIIKVKESFLKSLNCIRKGKPTNAGILLFGDNPQKFFRNSFIALARYKGERVGTERLDYKEFQGNLFQQIDNCDKYIKDHTAVMSRLHPERVRREDIPEYGRFSIRELITNAVCHRDYSDQGSKIIIKMFSDKIEFYNPGGLPKGITPENVTKEQHSRNPILARVLAKVEYIEEVGEGWDKIIKEHQEHPLKPKMPQIDSSKHSTTVTLFSTQDKFKKKERIQINDRQKRALQYLRKRERITTKDYKKLFPEISDRTALRDLKNLVDKEVIEPKGKKKGRYYVITK